MGTVARLFFSRPAKHTDYYIGRPILTFAIFHTKMEFYREEQIRWNSGNVMPDCEILGNSRFPENSHDFVKTHIAVNPTDSHAAAWDVSPAEEKHYSL